MWEEEEGSGVVVSRCGCSGVHASQAKDIVQPSSTTTSTSAAAAVCTGGGGGHAHHAGASHARGRGGSRTSSRRHAKEWVVSRGTPSCVALSRGSHTHTHDGCGVVFKREETPSEKTPCVLMREKERTTISWRSFIRSLDREMTGRATQTTHRLKQLHPRSSVASLCNLFFLTKSRASDEQKWIVDRR